VKKSCEKFPEICASFPEIFHTIFSQTLLFKIGITPRISMLQG
jgi:hypothetical protein